MTEEEYKLLDAHFKVQHAQECLDLSIDLQGPHWDDYCEGRGIDRSDERVERCRELLRKRTEELAKLEAAS